MTALRFLGFGATLVLASCTYEGMNGAPDYTGSGSSGIEVLTPGPVGTLSTPQIAPGDVDFIYQAASTTKSMVEDAQLALQRSVSPALQGIATAVVRDYGPANAAVEAMARVRGIATPLPVDMARQFSFAALSGLEGPLFETHFIAEQIEEHEVAVALFRSEAELSADPELRGFAVQTLPVLETHLAQLRTVKVPQARVSVR